jgi:hypothetical protein
MAKFVSFKIKWTASASPDVAGYKLYWNADTTQPDYTSTSLDVGNVTEVDDLAFLPVVNSDIVLGLTAYDNTGNESDMVFKTFFFDNAAPAPPTEFTVIIVL